ncbi:aldo/keto reductase [Spelaeicoccus albus]|uniref:D-threo-aldose 1-dehydrogenase n=1 Tax=Spelaeicoccus albus TaxID=1280376 RepID=A0A7Z0CZX7_9MICO|nr:aldo/keto reductase [Spelaeicoccus albus]NYI66699.1 D-threo-aldose 1-dehydrogenase [Spelaeicoccus albus]
MIDTAMIDTGPIDFGRLGYGAANVGNLYRALTDDEAWKVLDAAWESGVRYFDTAPHYGLGLSERRLGAFLQTKPRDQFVLSTKAGRLLVPNPDGAGTLDTANDFAVPADQRRVFDLSPAGIRASIDASLERLGIDRIDVVYLHDPERSGIDGAVPRGVRALAELRDQGLVRAIGVGSMTTGTLLEAARTDAIDLLMVAGRYTLADQPAAHEVLPECRSRGIGVVNAAVFNSGLLATNAQPADARFDYGATPPDVLERTRRIAAICAEFDVDVPTAALQFSLRDPVVTTVVAGARNPEQMHQNAARMDAAVPDEFWSALFREGLIPASADAES